LGAAQARLSQRQQRPSVKRGEEVQTFKRSLTFVAFCGWDSRAPSRVAPRRRSGVEFGLETWILSALMQKRFLISRIAGLLAVLCAVEFTASGADILPPGFRPLPPGAHALIGGKVIARPGEVLDGGVVIIRDGRIKEVGKGIAPPEDARIWDMRGTVIYAGFIDPYLVLNSSNAPISTTDSEPVGGASLTAGAVTFYGVAGQRADRGNAGPGYEIAKITPEYRAVRDYSPKEKTVQPLRELGFTAGVIAPSKGIIRGTSALVALVEENPNEVIIRPDVFQHIAFFVIKSLIILLRFVGVVTTSVRKIEFL